ncbi:MAG: 50S ribosome-binding GTPase, partial [Candidatus Riflebacteria bacterium]|nr:50S ribosome-binding GTPase [Candidatus Riflebacteria bacterium]
MNEEIRNKFNELKQKEGFKKIEERINQLIKIGKTDVKDIFNSEAFQEMFDQVSLLLGKEVKPTLLMIGKTGVGKSSVLNALFSNGTVGETKFDIGVTPTTRDFDRRLLHSDKCDIVAVDAPGFADPTSEANIDGMTYEDKLIEYAKTNEAHMALLVLKCDDRALEPECKFLKKWFAEEK